MRRYWRPALLLAFTIIIISVYYAEVSRSQTLNLYLRAEQGDPNEASPVILNARYKLDSVLIDSKGSLYRGPQWSYLDTLSSYYDMNGELKRLIKENRDFMRGKRYLNALFEEDGRLGYVGTGRIDSVAGQSNTLTISLYDKGTKESSSFKVSDIKDNVYDSIYISDVQIQGQTMKVLSLIHKQGKDYMKGFNPEPHLFTLDLKKKSLVEDRIIYPSDGMKHITIQGENGQTAPRSEVVFGWANQSDDYDLAVYDIWKDKWRKIESEPIRDMINQKESSLTPTIQRSGDDLYLTSRTDPDGMLRLICYGLSENKVKYELLLKDILINSKSSVLSTIANDRLYILTDQAPNPKVAIADLKSGKTVYKGTVTSGDNRAVSNLMIYGISTK